MYMKKYSSNKDIHKFILKLIKNKWSYASGKRHGSLYTPYGKRITVPGSPSDRRAFKNFVKDIERLNWKLL